MKIMALLMYILVALPAGAEAKNSQCPPGYQDKLLSIEHEIALAQHHHNQRRINGLKQAQDSLNERCSATGRMHSHSPAFTEIPSQHNRQK